MNCRPLLDMLLVVVLSPAVMMLFIYLTWRLRQRQRRKSELAPTDFVTKLPVRKFRREKDHQEQDDDHTECAICLEDYVDDDTLRTLPCRHEFHASCVDAWLTTHKKFASIVQKDFQCFHIINSMIYNTVSYLQAWYLSQSPWKLHWTYSSFRHSCLSLVSHVSILFGCFCKPHSSFYPYILSLFLFFFFFFFTLSYLLPFYLGCIYL